MPIKDGYTEDNVLNKMPDRLKKIQKALKLTLGEFAEKCGLPYTTLQSYMLNTRKPNIQNLIKISQAFNISLDWLAFGKGRMFLDKNQTMPDVFIQRVAKDIKNNKKDFDSVDVDFKRKVNAFLNGKLILSRVDVIKLAKALKQPINDYLSLANYIPEVFDKVMQNDKAVGMLRAANNLSDKEMDELMDVLAMVLEGYMASKKKR